MADDLDETLDDRLERIQRRAENFRELLKDGDEVTIAFQDGDLLVEESYRSHFERKHPKLFGRMLSIEEQMKAGTFPYFLGLLGVAVLAVGLQLGWWESVLGEGLIGLLNGWWFSVLAPAALLYVIYMACRWWGRWIYRRNRPELFDLIASSELDRDVLLVMLRDEEDLDRVVNCLKLDRAPSAG